jgi:prevent-host-death family protein
MFKEVGSFDAKAKLAELLRGVQNGESYTITLRGHPVANLVPYPRRQNARASVEAMRDIKKVRGVSSEDIANWITQGRK